MNPKALLPAAALALFAVQAEATPESLHPGVQIEQSAVTVRPIAGVPARTPVETRGGQRAAAVPVLLAPATQGRPAALPRAQCVNGCR